LAGLLLGAALGVGGALRPGSALGAALDRRSVQSLAGLAALALLGLVWRMALAGGAAAGG
jgi:hypothetical protein